MKLFIIFAVTILCVTGDQLEKWSTFKLKHKKSYKNVAEETQRFNIFKENLRTIEAHNVKYHNGEVGYFMGVNRFADMSPEEFRGMLNANSKNKPQLEAKVRKFDENVKLPEAVDWRDSGAVLPVKNQLTTCPSWWAFASTGALEAQNVILNNISIALSEQQILDCSGDYGNYGCEGGYGVRGAFHYVQDHGIASEEDYPYIAEDGNCKEGQVTPVISALFDYESVEMLNEAALLHAVAAIGPITTEINGDLIQFYQGGIFDDYGCLNGAEDLNYGGLLVGYNLTEGANYWILKNSWGTEWGEEGYIRIQQGLNICGITRSTNYPVLELN